MLANQKRNVFSPETEKASFEVHYLIIEFKNNVKALIVTKITPAEFKAF